MKGPIDRIGIINRRSVFRNAVTHLLGRKRAKADFGLRNAPTNRYGYYFLYPIYVRSET